MLALTCPSPLVFIQSRTSVDGMVLNTGSVLDIVFLPQLILSRFFHTDTPPSNSNVCQVDIDEELPHSCT